MPKNRYILYRIASCLAWFMPAALIYTLQASAAQPPGAHPVSVTAAPVAKLDIPIAITSFGRTLPVETATVQARVTSLVTEVKIEDGQRVKKGDVLFVLDSAPFAATVEKAKATLAHDTALAEIADLEDRRQLELLNKAVISQDAYDQVHASNLAAAAQSDISAADLKSAVIQLGYCSIVSPVDGVAGRVGVKTGNLAIQNGAALVTVNSLIPMRASLFAPEARLADIRAAMAKQEAKVFAQPADAGGEMVEGTLAFIDNQVDPGTGAIAMEAEFPNADLALWPGQYVGITLQLGMDKGALAVPDTALHPAADGTFLAAVVKQDGTVEFRTCEEARRYRGLAVVAKGLAEGEMVVLDGYLRLNRDSRVEIKQKQETKLP